LFVEATWYFNEQETARGLYNESMPAKSLLDDALVRILEEDQFILARTQFPIVTVSASFRDIVELQHTVQDVINQPDVVFSRAHYSMALAVAVAAWGKELVNREKAWLVDPTNYVSKEDWKRIAFSETIGRLMARNDLFAWLKKNILDKYGRRKLPITAAITGPLLFLCQDIKRPIISLHDQAGNILANTGQTIVQVVTDPFVRPEYLQHAELKTMYYCVFDEKTRFDFLELAEAMGKKVDPERVVVTGPPVDPRIVVSREGKNAASWHHRPLHLLLTTGGLGTNKEELGKILRQLLPLCRKSSCQLQLTYYAGTNADHAEMVKRIAKTAKIKLGGITDDQAKLRLLYADDVVTANQLLIQYGFPWADLIITKPSGDMAYDAVAAGCPLLLLEPWGEWEKSIQQTFLNLGLARTAEIKDIAAQLRLLTHPDGEVWLDSALSKVLSLPSTYLRGAHNILAVARRAGR
jgi:hypothetical protein